LNHSKNQKNNGNDPVEGALKHENQKILLVFERASQGTILQFLSKQLKDVAFVDSWEQVVIALSSIANGIMSLHEHGVLHR
jgi:hypothetical protein